MPKSFRYIAFVSILIALSLTIWKALTPNAQTKVGPFRNLVVVTIDTLRADHVSSYGYPRPTTPFIDTLASNGIRFKNAFSNIPHTAPSHATMFTGLFPFQHGLRQNHETLNSEIKGLAGIGVDAGFAVAGFPAVNFLVGKVGFPKTTLDGIDQSLDFQKYWYRNAAQVVDRSVEWIKTLSSNNTKRFILWVHFYDVHQWKGENNIPKEYLDWAKSLPQDSFAPFLVNQHNIPLSYFRGANRMLKAINGYDARLHYVDSELHRLYQAMDNAGKNDKTAWLVTSDHGEGLGNHFYLGHGEFLYNEQLQVPLILYSKNGNIPSKVITKLARLVDILPTALELLGLNDKIPQNISGRSLLSSLTLKDESNSNIFNFAERRPKTKGTARKDWEAGEIVAIHNLSDKLIDHSDGLDEIYNLQSDKFELNNIESKNSIIENELRAKLNEVLDQKSNHVRGTSAPQEMTPDEVEELKTLGYL